MQIEAGRSIAGAILFAFGIGYFFLGLRIGDLWEYAGLLGLALSISVFYDVPGKCFRRRLNARRIKKAQSKTK